MMKTAPFTLRYSAGSRQLILMLVWALFSGACSELPTETEKDIPEVAGAATAPPQKYKAAGLKLFCTQVTPELREKVRRAFLKRQNERHSYKRSGR